ncbi:flagellar hook-length control protein FliK [Leisingera sp. NJS204]|uniref:flagellar hook-length control protein FliK n=1 Tax=Leisingera sp. NJS204 TaxID=2508307 RepID=UPI0010119BB4|nr:flagellar hook-length control protein FliK [Leisingera sp. NJS204]QAX31550.1 flagellar hook-length control protein FliK [Leisingera sp. NJS204]
MNMNSILGLEAGSAGKSPSGSPDDSKKSNTSRDFSDFLSARSGPGEVAAEQQSAKGESAEAESEPRMQKSTAKDSKESQVTRIATGQDVPEGVPVQASQSTRVATGHDVPEGLPVQASQGTRVATRQDVPEGVPVQASQSTLFEGERETSARNPSRVEPVLSDAEMASGLQNSGTSTAEEAGAAETKVKSPHGVITATGERVESRSAEQRSGLLIVKDPGAGAGIQPGDGAPAGGNDQPDAMPKAASSVSPTDQGAGLKAGAVMHHGPSVEGNVQPAEKAGEAGNTEKAQSSVRSATQAAARKPAAAPENSATKLLGDSTEPDVRRVDVRETGNRRENTARVSPETAAQTGATATERAPAERAQVTDGTGQSKNGNAISAAQPKSLETGSSSSTHSVAQSIGEKPDSIAKAVNPAAQGENPGIAVNQVAVKGPGQKRDLASTPVSNGNGAQIKAEPAGIESPLADPLKGSDARTATVPAAPQIIQSAASQLQPLLAGGMTAGKMAAELLSGTDEALAGTLGLSSEAPGLTQLLTEASIGSHGAHRPEAPRMIAAQMAEAFAAKGEQKVEVSLNPQELGHVKMRVMASETGITMIIQTERPETGDLMRRHIHELAEEFRRMGYEDISFEFSGGQAGTGHPGDEADGGSGLSSGTAETRGADAKDAGEAATQNLRLGTAGVDMRV